MRVLDSHLHLWDPDLLDYDWLDGPLHARFAADELKAAQRRDGDQAAVFVQAGCRPEQFLDEVEWVAAGAGRTGVRGIVAGVQLDRGAETERDLDAAREHPLVVGVRQLLQDEPDDLAGTSAFRAGAVAVAARDLTFDACVRNVRQLRAVGVLAADLPQLRMVLDHLGKPLVGTAQEPAAPSKEWADAVHTLAALEQVWCKLSGLPAEAGGEWSAAQVVPFLDVALEAFGPERLMVGSDWPVSAVTASDQERAGRYDATDRPRWFDVVADWAASRALDVDAIMWRGAERFYRLG